MGRGRMGLRLGLVLAAGCGLLAACTTATPYQKADHSFGYAEAKVSPDHYRVAFAGNHKTTRQTVHKYVVYRAAELADADGYDYFVVDDASQRIVHYGDLRPRPTVRLDLGLEDGDSPADFNDDDDDGDDDNSVRSSVEAYEATIDITLYKDEDAIPEGSREIFNAGEVLRDLAPQIERPADATAGEDGPLEDGAPEASGDLS